MNDKKVKKFVEDYETKIKKLRDRYYDKLNSKEFKDSASTPNYNAISNLITLSICSMILIFYPGLIGDIIAIILSTISTIITRYIIKEDDNLQNNDYIREIRKYGYLTTESYEEKLKEYITGPCGVYKKELEELKDIYNINKNTTILFAQNNDRYYAWKNKEKNTVYFLNTKITEKPKVKAIHLDRVRYYRFDKTQKIIVLKTDNENFYFLPRSLEDIEEIFSGKQFKTRKSLTPEEYINDFETYINKIKKEIENKEKNYQKKKEIARNSVITTALIMLLCILLKQLVPELKIITIIIPTLTIFPYTLNLNRYFREYYRIPKNDYEIIQTINNNKNNINHFNELKISLKIDNTSKTIYTKEGIQYLVWVEDNYLHLFQNIINFNITYIIVKKADVKISKNKEECEIKFKDKKLYFKQNAYNILSNLLK